MEKEFREYFGEKSPSDINAELIVAKQEIERFRKLATAPDGELYQTKFAILQGRSRGLQSVLRHFVFILGSMKNLGGSSVARILKGYMENPEDEPCFASIAEFFGPSTLASFKRLVRKSIPVSEILEKQQVMEKENGSLR